LILSLFTPAFLVLIFGYALNMDVKNVTFVIYDQDRTPFTRQFAQMFMHSEYLSCKGYVTTYHDIDVAINSGKAVAALVIPYNFTENTKSGSISKLQLLLDASDSMSATIASAYFTAIVSQYNFEWQKNRLNRTGLGTLQMPVSIESRVWYNEELQSKNFVVPGIIVIVLAIISALITSLTISREWERGTMESLITTPVRSREVIAGKLIPYIFIGIFDVVITYLVGYFVFAIPIRGSFTELLLVSVLFLIGTCTFGLVISSATRIQVLSIQVAMIATYLPTILLSGFIFPIKNMPIVLQAITYIIPARYMISLIKGIALKGLAATLLSTQIIFMAVFALVMILVAIKKINLRYAG
ncbi:MAG: ABC transporter permease, partial [Spirochaetes bacterium]|nr:ABC transporter permease [Spirochaetota bacterium]